MNLFYLDPDPDLCAQAHVDKHVVKMPIEAAQALCTVLRSKLEIDHGYKSVYVNHPIMKWVGQTSANFEWMLGLGMALCREYTYRYERCHATEDVLRGVVQYLPVVRHDMPGPFSEPPKVVSADMKHLSTVEAYREYYRTTKARLHSWKNREVPTWI